MATIFYFLALTWNQLMVKVNELYIATTIVTFRFEEE